LERTSGRTEGGGGGRISSIPRASVILFGKAGMKIQRKNTRKKRQKLSQRETDDETTAQRKKGNTMGWTITGRG